MLWLIIMMLPPRDDAEPAATGSNRTPVLELRLPIPAVPAVPAPLSSGADCSSASNRVSTSRSFSWCNTARQELAAAFVVVVVVVAFASVSFGSITTTTIDVGRLDADGGVVAVAVAVVVIIVDDPALFWLWLLLVSPLFFLPVVVIPVSAVESVPLW